MLYFKIMEENLYTGQLHFMHRKKLRVFELRVLNVKLETFTPGHDHSSSLQLYDHIKNYLFCGGIPCLKQY
jgi:hypothetical protein